jgi:hypothetical protein
MNLHISPTEAAKRKKKITSTQTKEKTTSTAEDCESIKRAEMTEKNDPKQEGHSREWQDRARVVLDAKRDAQTESGDKQSPMPGEGEDIDNSPEKENRKQSGNDDPVY